MADTYIDAVETTIYGAFARDQMKEVCLGRVPELDAMVKYAIKSQAEADDRMKEVLARQPKAGKPLDSDAVLAEARDVIVRFGSHLDSLKGRPVDPKEVFQGDAPSVLARRRLVKLTAAVGHIREKLEEHKDKIRDVKLWRGELEEAHTKLVALDKQQRASRVEKADLGPDVAAERERWLVVYTANKSLIRGLLGHAGKPELMSVIFDDLAEVHRASGVTDDDAGAGAGAQKATGDGEGAEKG